MPTNAASGKAGRAVEAAGTEPLDHTKLSITKSLIEQLASEVM